MPDLFDRLKAVLADRYAIEQEIGAGGMATVYLAEDLKLHRKVALKVLRPELAAALGPERFLREIEIAANLHHPHILALHDSGEADSFLYYVMPYIEGESLRDKLNREKQLAVEETVEIAGPCGLFGAHVLRRPDGDPRLGQRFTTSSRDSSGNPKVRNHGVSRFEQNVLRFDVAVNHVVTVGVAQRVGHFASELERVV